MQQLFDAAMFGSTLRIMTPILLAALGGALCSRVGLFNVGLEGLVLIGAFSAIVGNYLFGNVLLAVLFSIVIVMLFSALFAFISINLKANAIVVGISLNFLAAGLTTFALRAIFDVKGAYYDKNMVGLPKWDIPLIKDIPGWVRCSQVTARSFISASLLSLRCSSICLKVYLASACVPWVRIRSQHRASASRCVAFNMARF